MPTDPDSATDRPDSPPNVLSPASWAGVRDLSSAPFPDDWRPPPAPIDVLVIPGIAAATLDKDRNTFPELETFENVNVHRPAVDDLGSSASNAAILADFLENNVDAPVIVVAHSKGAADFSELAVQHRDLASDKVRAAITISGVCNGSALVFQPDVMAPILQLLALGADPTRPTDHREILESLHSLRHESQQDRLRAIHAAGGWPVPVFCLTCATDSPFWALNATHKWLADGHGPNDGFVTIHEQLAPGSGYLGRVEIDHWAVAVDHPLLSADQQDRTRRMLLVRALSVALADLGSVA